VNQRVNQLIQLMENENFHALALNPGPSLSYLSGLHFHLSERPTILLILPGKKPSLILPKLELRKVESSGVDYQLFSYSDNPQTWSGAFRAAIQSLGLSHARIGIEPTQIRFLELNFLQQAAPEACFLPADHLIGKLRLQKDEHELKQMHIAVSICQAGLKATLPFLRVGISEKEIASELTYQLLKAGSEPNLGFYPIVASGPNSAVGHHFPSDRKIQAGDLLVIDWGASFAGYIADLTRTFAFGKVDPQWIRIAQVVLQANLAARNAVKPGVKAGIVDQTARQVIEAAGYGSNFVHRTGHGIGLEVHEPPYIFSENELILEPGMTFTIEPGIYLTGMGGVRIEDNVAVTPGGYNCLSDLPRDLVIID